MLKTALESAEVSPPPESILAELERISQSNSFRKAERCLRLLRYIVQTSLDGRSHELKEYTLGVNVFERPQTYDPRADPVVRLEARRLRLKLAEYYQHEGSDDPLVIDLPKGAYVPEFRFRSPVPPVLVQEAAPRPASLPNPPGPSRPLLGRWRLAIWLSAAVLLVATAIAIRYTFAKRPPALPMRASIAVLGFRDLSSTSETSWISAAVSELMNIDLASEQRLRVLPLENVARMRRELSLSLQPVFPVQLLQRIGTNLGADYVVSGSYLLRAGRMRMDIMLFEARSGQQVDAISEESSGDKFADLTRQCANRIRAQLGVRISAAGGAVLEAAAIEPYARGMEALRQGDALSARAYLENAVAAAPSNPLVHSGLAAAWSALGLDTRAVQEAKQAFESAGALERIQQLEIEGRYRTLAHDWPRAIQVYQALATLSPDDLEYGLLLASVQSQSGNSRDTLTLVDSLRKLPSPLRDDPRIDMAEARAAGALSDFVHTRQAAHRAAEKANARGARWQYAKARLLESGAMQTLAVPGSADVRAEARRICAELADRACVAAAYRIEANDFAMKGDLSAARPIYATVLDLANELGNYVEKLNALQGLAFVDRYGGDLRAAEADDRAALAVASELGPQKTFSVSLGLAEIVTEQGRVAEGQILAQKALEIAKKIGEQEGTALCEAAFAHTLALQGRFADAAARYTKAVAILRDVQGPSYLALTLIEFGDLELDNGNLAAARKLYEQAPTTQGPKRDRFVQPQIDMAFARLSLAEGHAADAVARSRAAMDAFVSTGQQGGRLQAAALLVRALIANRRIAEASAIIQQMPPLDDKTLPPRALIEYKIARCLLSAATGHREEASRTMKTLVAETAKLGLPPLVREAQLAQRALP